MYLTLKAILQKSDGELSVQLSDLIVFVGYFGLCLYVGGIAQISSFNAEFGHAVLTDGGIVPTALMFVQSFESGIWGFLGLSILIFLLSALFFVSRFALRLYFGFILNLTTFCLLLVISSALGSMLGENTASIAVTVDESALPTFKASGYGEKFSSGAYRLLHDDGDYLYVIQPLAKGSLKQLHILLKKNLNDYEVTIK